MAESQVEENDDKVGFKSFNFDEYTLNNGLTEIKQEFVTIQLHAQKEKAVGNKTNKLQ